jgi:hypothetical protein
LVFYVHEIERVRFAVEMRLRARLQWPLFLDEICQKLQS